MTVSEKTLWLILKGRRLGFQFRRQYPVGPYILDFYCPEASLCVEVDGELHLDRQSRDQRRDAWLLAQGVATVRIPSLDLFDRDNPKLTAWAEHVRAMCEQRSGREAFAKHRARKATN